MSKAKTFDDPFKSVYEKIRARQEAYKQSQQQPEQQPSGIVDDPNDGVVRHNAIVPQFQSPISMLNKLKQQDSLETATDSVETTDEPLVTEAPKGQVIKEQPLSTEPYKPVQNIDAFTSTGNQQVPKSGTIETPDPNVLNQSLEKVAPEFVQGERQKRQETVDFNKKLSGQDILYPTKTTQKPSWSDLMPEEDRIFNNERLKTIFTETPKFEIPKEENQILTGLKNWLDVPAEGLKRLYEGMRQSSGGIKSLWRDTGYNEKDIARGFGNQVNGALQVGFNMLPAVQGLNLSMPTIESMAGTMSKDLFGLSEETGKNFAHLVTPFIFGKWVGLGSLGSLGIEEAMKDENLLDTFGVLSPQIKTSVDEYKAMSDADKQLARELVSHLAFFAVLGAGKKFDKAYDKRIKEAIDEMGNIGFGGLRTSPGTEASGMDWTRRVPPDQMTPMQKKVWQAYEYTKGRNPEELAVIEGKVSKFAPTFEESVLKSEGKTNLGEQKPEVKVPEIKQEPLQEKIQEPETPKKYYRGEREGQSGEVFITSDEEVAKNFGKVKEISDKEIPQKLFEADDKVDLANKLGLTIDQATENQVAYSPDFDKKVKDILQKQGYEGIKYLSGTFDAEEIHVFGKGKKEEVRGKSFEDEVAREKENVDLAIESAKLDKNKQFEGVSLEQLQKDKAVLESNPTEYFARLGSRMSEEFTRTKDPNVKFLADEYNRLTEEGIKKFGDPNEQVGDIQEVSTSGQEETKVLKEKTGEANVSPVSDTKGKGKKDILDTAFQHHSWYIDANKTKREALDEMAGTGDFVLDKKPAKRQSDNLFDPTIYEDILRYTGKEKGTYKLSPEEKIYFLERQKYHQEQKKLKNEEILKSEVDAEIEFKKEKSGSSLYDVEYAKQQLDYWENTDKDNEIDKIDFWKNEIKQRTENNKIADKLFQAEKDKIKTKGDFRKFTEQVKSELTKSTQSPEVSNKVEKQIWEHEYRAKEIEYPDFKKGDTITAYSPKDDKKIIVKVEDVDSKGGYKISIDGEIQRSRSPKGYLQDLWQISKMTEAGLNYENVPKEILDTYPDNIKAQVVRLRDKELKEQEKVEKQAEEKDIYGEIQMPQDSTPQSELKHANEVLATLDKQKQYLNDAWVKKLRGEHPKKLSAKEKQIRTWLDYKQRLLDTYPELTPKATGEGEKNVEPSKETWKQFWQESNQGTNLTEEIISKYPVESALKLRESQESGGFGYADTRYLNRNKKRKAQIEEIFKKHNISYKEVQALYEKLLKKEETPETPSAKETEAPDTNKSAALRMFSEGKKDTDVVTALGLKGKAGMDQVREWRKEYKEIDKLYTDRIKKSAKNLEENKKVGTGTNAYQNSVRLHQELSDDYENFKKGKPTKLIKKNSNYEPEPQPKPETKSKGIGEEKGLTDENKKVLDLLKDTPEKKIITDVLSKGKKLIKKHQEIYNSALSQYNETQGIKPIREKFIEESKAEKEKRKLETTERNKQYLDEVDSEYLNRTPDEIIQDKFANGEPLTDAEMEVYRKEQFAPKGYFYDKEGNLQTIEKKKKSEVKEEQAKVEEIIDEKLKPGLSKKTETTEEFNKKRDYIVNELQKLIDEILDNGVRSDRDNTPDKFRELIQKQVESEKKVAEQTKGQFGDAKTDFDNELSLWAKKFNVKLDADVSIQVPEDGVINLKKPDLYELIQLRNNAKRLNFNSKKNYLTPVSEAKRYTHENKSAYDLEGYDTEVKQATQNLEMAKKNDNKKLEAVFTEQLKQLNKISRQELEREELYKEALTYPSIKSYVNSLDQQQYSKQREALDVLELVKKFGLTKKDAFNVKALYLAKRLDDLYGSNIQSYIDEQKTDITKSEATLKEFERKDGKKGYRKTNKTETREMQSAWRAIEASQKSLRELEQNRAEIEKLLGVELTKVEQPIADKVEKQPQPEKAEKSENTLVEKYANLLADMNVKDQMEYLKENNRPIPPATEIDAYRERSTQQNVTALNKLKDAIDNKNYDTLASLLHTGNKTYRKFFAESTGITLPNTEGKTKETLKEFTGYVEPPKEETTKLSKEEAKAKMEQARADSILSKKLNYSGFGVLTRKEFIDKVIKQGWLPETEEVKAIKDPTRTQFNRMDQREQDEFERRQKEAGMKTEYLVRNPEDRSSYTITKAEYDYALSKQQPTVEKESPKESLSAKSEEQITSPEFKEWFGDWENEPQYSSKVVNDNGKPLVVYSGHGNTPLYKNYDPKKATAGGFYSSEDPQVASNYSLGKFGAKEGFENGSQYRIKGKNGKYNKKLWQIELTDEQKKILDRLSEEQNELGENRFNLNEMMRWAKENRDYEPLARRILARGKYDLQSIHDYNEWMGYNIAYPKQPTEKSEPYFERQVKNDTEEIMDALGLEWQAYDWNQPGVFPVYLNIRKPLDADQPFPQDLMQALKEKAKYERSKPDSYGMMSTQWTNEYPLKEWINDIEEGNEGWTTQIPKKALPILKQFGYDGIKERGNKGMSGVLPREERQINWIAFEPTQIKSAIANKGTFDKNNKDMLLSAGNYRIEPEDDLTKQIKDFFDNSIALEDTDLEFWKDRRIIIATRANWIKEYKYDPVKQGFRIVKPGEEGYDPKEIKFKGTVYGAYYPPSAENGWRGKVVFYGKTDLATAVEEIIHRLQERIGKQDSDVKRKIGQWESEVRQAFAEAGVTLPLGHELLAKTVVKQLGYGVPELHGINIKVPQSIFEEITNMLSESKSGEDIFPKLLPTNINTALGIRQSKAEEDSKPQGFTFEKGKLDILSAKHPDFAPPFFSKLQTTIDAKLPKSFNAKQLNDILRSGEIKEAEIKWSGIDDFLKEKIGKGEKITKQEVMDFLKMNELQVKEVTKHESSNMVGDMYMLRNLAVGDATDIGDFSIEVQEDNYGEKYYAVSQYDEANQDYGKTKRFEDAEDVIDYIKGSDTTKFSQYTLPGGINQREFNFVLPRAGMPTREIISHEQAKSLIARGRAVEVYRNGNFIGKATDHITLSAYNIPDGSITFREYDEYPNPNIYKVPSAHQYGDEADINRFAHTRTNDRTVNGKKYLHIEEVQSDWSLALRKNPNKFSRDTFELARDIYVVKQRFERGDVSKAESQKELSKLKEIADSKNITQEEILKAKEFYGDFTRGYEAGTPPMPFANNWHEFVLKNLLRKASEEGYDGITWVTGEQTAERYDLSKQVDHITSHNYKDDSGKPSRYVDISLPDKLISFDIDENGTITRNTNTVLPDVIGKNLADIVGKDITEKILNQTETKHKYEGVDLKVGGQWATNLYDKVIPNFLTKYGKKWNAKVGGVELTTDKRDKFTAQGSLSAFDDWVKENYPDKYNANLVDNEYHGRKGKWFDEYKKTVLDLPQTKVHSLDITPEMKQSVLYEGQPLFNAKKELPTDTPEFKRWFGNSKVVDESGNPLVVYHGTADQIESFDKEQVGKNFKDDKEGFFFTNNVSHSAYDNGEVYEDMTSAGAYAKNAAYVKNKNYQDISGANILPVYLNIQNPYIIDSKDLDNGFDGMSSVAWLEAIEGKSRSINIAKMEGHDGIIVIDRSMKFENGEPEKLIIAFEPTQIKSIYNEGSFNPDNPNIMLSAKGEEPNQIDFGVGLGQVVTNLADKIQAARMTKEFEKKNGIERNPKLKKVYREFLTSPQWFFDKEPQLQRVWDIIDKNHVRKVNEEIAILKEEIWTNGKAWRKLPDNSKQRLLDELKKYEAEIYEAQNNGAKKLPFKTFEQFADQLSPEGKEFVLNTYKPLIKQAFEYVKEVDRYTIISRTPENPALEDYNSYKGNDKKEIAKLLEEAKQRFFNLDPNAEAEFENALLRQNKNPDEVKALNEAWNKNRGLRENIAEVLIDEKYKNIEGKMYFPSSRLGRKYFLSAVKKYNAPSMMPGMTPENFFTTDDRPQYLEQVKRDMQSKGYDVTIGKFAEAQEDILKNAVTQEDLLDLAILTGIETDNKVLDRLLKSVLAKGFTKHFIPKKFTPGFQYTNENFETAIDKYIGSVPYFKNRTIGNFELDDELSSLKDAGILKTGSNNDKYIQDLRNKLESRDETIGQGLRAAASVWYLALRPSYLAQQIVQPINTLLPLLPVTAKELGLNTVEAEKAFGESMVSGITYYTWKIADKLLRLQGKKGLSSDFGLGKEFLEVIKTLEQQGVGKPLRSLEIIGEQTDPTKYYNPNPVVEGTSLFAKLLGLPGIFVEDFTRAQGIRAFYNLGKKAGLKGDNLVDFISNQIAKSYGSASGRLSKPPGYKVEGNNILSKGLRTIVESHLTFKNFAFMNYGQWGKMYRALKDDHLVRPLLYKLGAQAGIGGLKYMMWVSTVLSLLSLIYGALDIPEDPEQQYEESFKQLNKFVPGLGDALYKGVASTTFKVDLSSLFSQQAPFITEDAAYKQNLSDALEGAPIQLAQDLYTGVTTGNTKKMLPAGIKNIVSANDYGSKGVNFGSRQIIPSDQEYEKQMKEYEKGKRNAPPVKPVDETEKTAKQLGFTPLRVSDAYQKERSRTTKAKQISDIVRNTVSDDIIPLIDAGKGYEAKKKFIDLFEMVKKNGSMTEFQAENIKDVDQFISRFVMGKLEIRSEEREKLSKWRDKFGKNPREKERSRSRERTR